MKWKAIWKRLLKIECLTLQLYADLKGIADFGPTLEYKGQVLSKSGWLGFIIVGMFSVFGEIVISRKVYGVLT